MAHLLLGLGLPEQAMGWSYPFGLGLVAEDKPTEFSCSILAMQVLPYYANVPDL